MDKKVGIDKALNQILNNISKLYDQYDERSIAMSQQKRRKMGAQIDKQQKRFMSDLEKLEQKMIDLIKTMDQEPAMKKPQFKSHPGMVKFCLQDIQSILKKKNLLFKVNQPLQKLIQQTTDEVGIVKKQLETAKKSKFCCCGTDGVEYFNKVMLKFKINTRQWNLLASLQPKDSVETFISPNFSANDFLFIKQILNKFWPKQTVNTVYVEKPVNMAGKPSRLIQANEYIYGINRQENPSHGLKIYHQEAEKDDAAAACYLGQVYQQGVLLPRDVRKSSKYYQIAMRGKQPYAFCRYAMGLIKGQFKDTMIQREDLQTAFKYLNQITSGDNPNPQALVQLASFYQKGRFDCDKHRLFATEPDLKKAIDYYLKARSRRVPRASNNLGVLYINNKNMSPNNPNRIEQSDQNQYSNLQKGMKYLEQAQQLGFTQAFYNIGCVYESGIMGRKNPQEALMSFYKGGMKGDLQSRLKFAYQLMSQTSIMKDQYEDHYRMALRWLDSIVHRIDIEQQVYPYSSQIGLRHTPNQKAQALFYLGLMHEYGFGVDKNPLKSFNYYIQSSQLGFPAAKNKIGDCYFSGFGVRQDRKTAIDYYYKAADLKNSDAFVNLGTIFLNGIPGLVQRNYNQAYSMFLKAVDDENSNALVHLSYMYKSGLGLEKDRQMAKKLLQQSANSKNPTAIYLMKQYPGNYDQKSLLSSLDTQIFSTPRRINVNQIIPYVEHIN